MKPKSILFCVAVLLTASAGDLPGQEQPGGGAPLEPPVRPIDPTWQVVKELGRLNPTSEDPIGDLLRDADQLAQFYTQNPTHSQAANAKCLEALALVQAWLVGDTSQATRREGAVAVARRNKSTDPGLRAELFALSDTVSITKQENATRQSRLASFEQATRALIAEFPDLPNGYESLLAIARDSDDEHAAELAGEIGAMAGAPAAVRAGAEALARRFALIGGALGEIATAIRDAKDVFRAANGRRLFIYAWHSGSVFSIQRAKALAGRAAADDVLVGLCLDENVSAGKARAASESLPGNQFYDAAGRLGALAKVLAMDEPGLIYQADASGILRSVTVQNHLLAPAAASLE